MRDESEIRGHRRTYVGAMPGTIVRAIRDAGAMNPVLMVDEIDKMGADVRGDPSSAMLEVLDPAQNSTFRDHYLDLPLDLSRILFLCTANVLETIPGPLLDRMEVIRLSGYTEDEKLHIARRYLLPRQIAGAGLPDGALEVTDEGLATVISEYTREAGVRQLERRLGAIARRIARRVAEGDDSGAVLGGEGVREILGPERIHNEVKRRTSEPGVATGLAVTGAGGEILFVEAIVMPGGGKLSVTGQIGDVMRESAQAAVSYVRARAAGLGLDLAEDYFSTHDIHLHVPAGAVPKDGPSAGVTMVTALVSALSGRPVSEDVAMTGEITLTGQVLPIGGVKEKVLAARRAGIGGVILPKLNEDQLADLPPGLAEEMRITLADRVEQVLDVALEPAGARAGRIAPARIRARPIGTVMRGPRGAATSTVMASPATSISTGSPMPTHRDGGHQRPAAGDAREPVGHPGAQRVARRIGPGGPARPAAGARGRGSGRAPPAWPA